MQDAIVIKPFVADQVKNAMIHGRVIFFSAPCGFGKTTTAWALLEGKKVYFAAAGEPGFRLPLLRETWDVLLLDQLQNPGQSYSGSQQPYAQPSGNPGRFCLSFWLYMMFCQLLSCCCTGRPGGFFFC